MGHPLLKASDPIPPSESPIWPALCEQLLAELRKKPLPRDELRTWAGRLPLSRPQLDNLLDWARIHGRIVVRKGKGGVGVYHAVTTEEPAAAAAPAVAASKAAAVVAPLATRSLPGGPRATLQSLPLGAQRHSDEEDADDDSEDPDETEDDAAAPASSPPASRSRKHRSQAATAAWERRQQRGGDTSLSAETFVRLWQTARSAEDLVAHAQGTLWPALRARAVIFRKKGVPLKTLRQPRRRSPLLDLPALATLARQLAPGPPGSIGDPDDPDDPPGEK